MISYDEDDSLLLFAHVAKQTAPNTCSSQANPGSDINFSVCFSLLSLLDSLKHKFKILASD